MSYWMERIRKTIGMCLNGKIYSKRHHPRVELHIRRVIIHEFNYIYPPRFDLREGKRIKAIGISKIQLNS
jgi:hypothetical protein